MNPRSVGWLFWGAGLLLGCSARVTVGVVDSLPPDASAPPPSDFDAAFPPPARPDAAARLPDGGVDAITPGCEGKECGDFCLPCDGDAATCPRPQLFHVCTSELRCLPQQPSCLSIATVDAGPPGYVPCVGLACGAACPSCNPASPNCVPEMGFCAVDGSCDLDASSPPACP